MGRFASKPKSIYVVGNPLLKDDSMPLRLLPLLQKACPNLVFELFEPTRMDIPHNVDLTFIDTVQGVKKTVYLHGLKALASSNPAYSLHDFDLGVQLLLLDKFGLLGHVHIIGVPARGNVKKIAHDVLHILKHDASV